MIRRIVIGLIVLLSTSPLAHANVIIWATGSPPTATPSNLQKQYAPSDIGTNGFFDIFVSTNVQVVGMDLDVLVQGSSIELTSTTVPNYTGPRWAEVMNGTVIAPSGKEAQGMMAFADPGSGSTGMNPAAPDNGFLTPPGAFHFGRVNYRIVGPGTSNIFFRIGETEVALAAPTDLFLGAGDNAIATNTTGDRTGGLQSTLADGSISVVPEPASVLLVGIAAAGLACLSRRRRG